jgi:hypothetical protein
MAPQPVRGLAVSDDGLTLKLARATATPGKPFELAFRYRGHGWRASTEMSASMFLPTFTVIALLWVGLVDDVGVLLVIEHVAMVLGMLGAMMLRPAESWRRPSRGSGGRSAASRRSCRHRVVAGLVDRGDDGVVIDAVAGDPDQLLLEVDVNGLDAGDLGDLATHGGLAVVTRHAVDSIREALGGQRGAPSIPRRGITRRRLAHTPAGCAPWFVA